MWFFISEKMITKTMKIRNQAKKTKHKTDKRQQSKLGVPTRRQLCTDTTKVVTSNKRKATSQYVGPNKRMKLDKLPMKEDKSRMVLSDINRQLKMTQYLDDLRNVLRQCEAIENETNNNNNSNNDITDYIVSVCKSEEDCQDVFDIESESVFENDEDYADNCDITDKENCFSDINSRFAPKSRSRLYLQPHNENLNVDKKGKIDISRRNTKAWLHMNRLVNNSNKQVYPLRNRGTNNNDFKLKNLCSKFSSSHSDFDVTLEEFLVQEGTDMSLLKNVSYL